jgi:hypothetical protein
MNKYSEKQRGEIRLYGFVSANGKSVEEIIDTLKKCSIDKFDNINEEEFAPIKSFVNSLIDGTLGAGVLNDFNYWESLADFGSALEEIFAVFSNVLIFSEKGAAANFEDASRRAAQRILVWHLGEKYSPEPEFRDEELFLHT